MPCFAVRASGAPVAVFVLPLATLAGGGAEERRPLAEEPPVCLLTGFEPFGPFKQNASWETVKSLEGETIAGYRIAVAQLPVVYDEVAAPLRAALEKHRPRIAIGFGVGAATVRLESTARNGYHTSKPLDNRRRRPPRDEIVPGGPATLPAALPLEAIARALREARIGVASSDDAGGYLCNECFYRLMALRLEGPAANVRARGFVHLPPFGEKDPEGGEFDLKKLQRAVRIIVEQTARQVAADAPKQP